MKNYFEGWYFKHQKGGKTLSLIPGRSSEAAFIQIIANDCSYYVDYDLGQYSKGRIVQIGGNTFARNKITLDIDTADVKLDGKLSYRDLTPLKSDIMGPFQFFPMECRHAVVSMRHVISGSLRLNGREFDFSSGTGYIEADSGHSFPENYAWVQCNCFDEKCSVMASIAKIPFMGFHFDGCICAVWYRGKEYRLATYLGAKVALRSENRLELVQGGLRLTVDIFEHSGQKLSAPQHGQMNRMIRESAATKARFRFHAENRLLFDKTSDNASFEFVL